MKKVIALILAVMLVFSLCIFSTSAADKTITPSATIGGQTVMDTIHILEGMGLYKAELRQTNETEE